MKGRAGFGGPDGTPPAGRQEVGPPPRTASFETARIAPARPDNSRGGPTMSNPTRWVGIDLHRRRSQIAVIDEHGELTLSKRVPTGRETIVELLGEPEGTHVALEATYGWEWLAELLEEAGYGVHLAHPLRTRAIAAARVKTDAVDAKTLAHLLRTGMLPEAYIAPPELRDLRDLLRHRATLVHLRTSIKNRVHALLARQGILPEYSDLFGKAGRAYLSTLELPDGPRRRLDSLLALIVDFDREITATTSEIEQHARADERVKLLCQIRGIGRYTAMLIIAEIGEVKRFPSAKHLCQWAGLTPTVRSSDGKARLGHISRQGSTILRWALTEAAQHTPSGGGPLRTKYERIAKRRGSKIAKVAIAREILTLCYHGLKDGEIRCLAKHPTKDIDSELADAA
jgi:transposase